MLIGGSGSGVASGTVTIGSNGVVNQLAGGVSVGANSKLSLTGGTLTVAPSKSLASVGIVEGTGTISRNGTGTAFSITNGKTFRAGLSGSGGLMTITNGTFTQSAGAVLDIPLGDPNTLTFGRIALTGGTFTVNNGSIDFTSAGFTPAPNTAYAWDLITAPTLAVSTGILNTAALDAKALLYPGGNGSVTLTIVGGQTLHLSAIPEPGAASLAILGAAGGVVSFRRKRL
jgi:hypothetical protein